MSARQPLLAVELTLVASELISREERSITRPVNTREKIDLARFPSAKRVDRIISFLSYLTATLVIPAAAFRHLRSTSWLLSSLYQYAVVTGGIGELIRRNRRKDFGDGCNRPVSRYRMTYTVPAFYRTSVRTRRVHRRGLTFQMASDIFFSSRRHLYRDEICVFLRSSSNHVLGKFLNTTHTPIRYFSYLFYT